MGEGVQIEDLVEGNERVMGYSQWMESVILLIGVYGVELMYRVSRQNQEYVEASNKLENVSAMLEQVEAMVCLRLSCTRRRDTAFRQTSPRADLLLISSLAA